MLSKFKSVASLFFCLFLAGNMCATQVLFSVRDFAFASSSAAVTIKPLKYLQKDGSYIIAGGNITTKLTGGSLTIALQPGDYNVNISGVPQSFTIHVPDTNSTVSAASISEGILSYYYNVGPLSTTTAGTNVSVTYSGGTNTISADVSHAEVQASTNGLASIAYVNAATNGLGGSGIPIRAGTNTTVASVGGTNVVNADVSHAEVQASTNGLASIIYVNTATNGFVTSAYVQSATNGLVTASVTNGLASTAYVNGATNGLVTASITNGLASTSYVASVTGTLLATNGNGAGLTHLNAANITGALAFDRASNALVDGQVWSTTQPVPLGVWHRHKPALLPDPRTIYPTAYALAEPKVIYDGGIFKMWYGDPYLGGVAYSFSTNGLDFVRTGIVTPIGGRECVIKHSGLFYAYSDSPGCNLYSSINESNFTLAASDVLARGAISDWDYELANKFVWWEGTNAYMMYEATTNGGNVSGHGYQIGLASSSDGTNWTKYASNPVIPGDATIGGFGGPCVVKTNNLYYCWVHTEDVRHNYRFQSSDLHTWTRYPSSPVFYAVGDDEGEATSLGQASDCTRLEVNGKVYLFYNALNDAAYSLPSDYGSIKVATYEGTMDALCNSLEDSSFRFDPQHLKLGVGTSSPIQDLDVSSGNVHIGGMLGVGINPPVKPLNVLGYNIIGKFETDSALAAAGIALYTPSGHIMFGREQPAGGAILTGDLGSSGVIASDNPLQFGVNDAVVVTMLIGGNVGIGTTNPASLLSVNGSIGGTTITATNFAGGAISGIGLNVTNAGVSALIVTNGNVGIGVVDPLVPLDINGSRVRISQTTGIVIAHMVNSGGYFKVGKENSTGGSLVTGDIPYASVLSSEGASPIQFGVNDAVDVTIANGGNVGIGTTNPASLLSVNGSIGGTTITATNGFVGPRTILAAGTATLGGGSNLVMNANAQSTNIFMLTYHSLGGTLDIVGYKSVTNGASFTIICSDPVDTNQVDWAIIKP